MPGTYGKSQDKKTHLGYKEQTFFFFSLGGEHSYSGNPQLVDAPCGGVKAESFTSLLLSSHWPLSTSGIQQNRDIVLASQKKSYNYLEGCNPKYIQVKGHENICKAKMSLGGKCFSLEYGRSAVLGVKETGSGPSWGLWQVLDFPALLFSFL